MDRLFGAKRHNDWPKIRKEWLRGNPTCAVCKKKARTPHHKKPVHLFPEEELNFNNLVTLCSTCHLLIGHLKNYRSYNKDIDIDIPIWNKKIIQRP